MRFDKNIDFKLLFAIGYNRNCFVNIIINAHMPERLQCVCMHYLNNNVTIFSSGLGNLKWTSLHCVLMVLSATWTIWNKLQRKMTLNQEHRKRNVKILFAMLSLQFYNDMEWKTCLSSCLRFIHIFLIYFSSSILCYTFFFLSFDSAGNFDKSQKILFYAQFIIS